MSPVTSIKTQGVIEFLVFCFCWHFNWILGSEIQTFKPQTVATLLISRWFYETRKHPFTLFNYSNRNSNDIYQLRPITVWSSFLIIIQMCFNVSVYKPRHIYLFIIMPYKISRIRCCRSHVLCSRWKFTKLKMFLLAIKSHDSEFYHAAALSVIFAL